MGNEPVKTGTTCVALKWKNGVVLATDMRMSAGYIVHDDWDNKVSALAKKIGVTISGLVSQAQLNVRVLQAEIRLKELRCERDIFVKEAAAIVANMQFRNARSMAGAVVGHLVGGVDKEGNHIFNVGIDGSLVEIKDFAANGSGSIFIKSLLKNEFKPDLSEKEAVALAQKAIISATEHDMASGGGVVTLVIDQNGTKLLDNKIIKKDIIVENGNN